MMTFQEIIEMLMSPPKTQQLGGELETRLSTIESALARLIREHLDMAHLQRPTSITEGPDLG